MKLTDDEKLNYENPHPEHKHEKSAHQPSSSSSADEKHQGASDEHHRHQSPRPNPKLQKSVSTTSGKKATQLEKKASKQSLGCIQKPRLPEELRQRAAVREDLSKFIQIIRRDISISIFSYLWSQRLQ